MKCALQTIAVREDGMDALAALSSKAYKKFPKHSSHRPSHFIYFSLHPKPLLCDGLVSRRGSPALTRSLQECFWGNSFLWREPNWTNMLVTSLHAQIRTSQTHSKTSGFRALPLSRILARLIGLSWCVSLVEDPLFQIRNNHMLSQAHTLLHSWRTPIPRRILPFCVLSKKCPEFGMFKPCW